MLHNQTLLGARSSNSVLTWGGSPLDRTYLWRRLLALDKRQRVETATTSESVLGNSCCADTSVFSVVLGAPAMQLYQQNLRLCASVF